MAKAKEITGLDCSADALEWAATVLRVRFEEIVELHEAALDFSDIEGVHAMRVATRRLRSALRDFLPLMDKRPLKGIRKSLKQVADALGAVRDQDVAIEALEQFHTEAEGEPIKAGIRNLLDERNQTRESARSRLIEAISLENIAELQKNFAEAIEKSVRKRKQNKFVSFNEAGRKVVIASLEELCDLGTSLYEPFNIEALHEMRIAAKRLRYAIELFTACWGEKIAPFAVEIAKMQSFLGDVHDYDIWIEALGTRLLNQKKAVSGSYQADVWLLSEFVKKRSRNYRAALELWSEWQTNDFTNRMQAMISQ
jgi:CHAD domain-containing protein